MPIEIRELIVKTEISAMNGPESKNIKDRDLAVLKRKLLDECKKLIASSVKNNQYKR